MEKWYLYEVTYLDGKSDPVEYNVMEKLRQPFLEHWSFPETFFSVKLLGVSDEPFRRRIVW